MENIFLKEINDKSADAAVELLLDKSKKKLKKVHKSLKVGTRTKSNSNFGKVFYKYGIACLF